MTNSEKAVRCKTFDLQIEDVFVPYAPAAATRTAYLHPSIQISVEEAVFRIRTPPDVDPSVVTRDLLHAVYREKIASDTAHLRARLFEVLGK